MKKLTIYFFIFLLAGVLFSFKPDNTPRNIITFDDGLTYYWRADNCVAPYVPALTQRSMRSTKGFYMVDITFQLPQGHCDIPSRGTAVTRYISGDEWAVIQTDGLVRGKILVTPKK
jgi:hypothetical protein